MIPSRQFIVYVEEKRSDLGKVSTAFQVTRLYRVHRNPRRRNLNFKFIAYQSAFLEHVMSCPLGTFFWDFQRFFGTCHVLPGPPSGTFSAFLGHFMSFIDPQRPLMSLMSCPLGTFFWDLQRFFLGEENFKFLKKLPKYAFIGSLKTFILR